MPYDSFNFKSAALLSESHDSSRIRRQEGMAPLSSTSGYGVITVNTVLRPIDDYCEQVFQYIIDDRRMLHRVRPRLVTFDVTGTLLMTKLVEHYSEIASHHGVTVSNSAELARSFKNNFKRLEREHPVYGKHTGLGWENWWRQIVYNVFKDQDSRVTDESLEKIANSLIECYGTSKCWHKYPGVVDILDYLNSRGLVLGIISNFDERLDSVLTSTNIKSYFSFVITSYTYGVEKPNSSIFEEALRLTRQIHGIKVKPEEALHIGDTLENDYIGAKNARWNAVLVNHHDDAIDENKVPRSHQFKSLQHLQSHLGTVLDKYNDERPT